MRNSTLNYLVDFITFLLVVTLAATGLILEFVLPPGSGGRGEGAAGVLLNWTRHDWGDLHFYIACGLSGLLVLHLALHWSWICAITQKLVTSPRTAGTAGHTPRPRRSAYGVGFLLVLAGFFGGVTWLGMANVPTRNSRPLGSGGPRIASMINAGNPGGNDVARSRPGGTVHNAESNIRGSTTLAEAAASCGATVAGLRAALNLPDSVEPDERLGRLRRQHGLTISDAREAVERLRQQKAN